MVAHPGIGIVKDSKGNIYYTDLENVWKISLDGNKSKVVSNVHTHELYMDERGNLYGEHLWYNGESQNTWGHYDWCLKNTGELVKVSIQQKAFQATIVLQEILLEICIGWKDLPLQKL